MWPDRVSNPGSLALESEARSELMRKLMEVFEAQACPLRGCDVSHDPTQRLNTKKADFHNPHVGQTLIESKIA